MTKWILVLVVVVGVVFFAGTQFPRDNNQTLTAQVPITKWARFWYYYKLKNVEKVVWAGHQFERAILDTNEYRTDGNKAVQFTKSGYYAPSYSLPRAKLLGVNMNEKVKVVVRGTLEGELKDLKQANFSEFAIYLTDEKGNARGLRQLGSKHNARSANKPTFKFTEFSVENTGSEIVITDSSGFSLSYTKDFKYVIDKGHKEENLGGNYGDLDPKQKWFLQINCHVNGPGHCKLDIREIKVTK